ncbi:MAG: glutathione S-transferase family protein [Steroidobacteraceae bacterium]
MKLYEFGPTRSIRVRWMLQELDVPFESIQVNLAAGEHKRPEFLKVNPAGKLPAFVDGDLVLNESIAIVLYLADKFANKGFAPTDLKDRAEYYRWLLFTTNELEQPLWRIARNTNVYPEKDRLAEDVPLACRDFKPMAAVLREHMRGREFVVGDRVTAADFVLAYTLDWANEAELLGEYPELVQYMERMYSRPKAPMRIVEAFAQIGQGN